MHPAPLLTRRVPQPYATQAAIQSAEWQFGGEKDLYLEGSVGQMLTCVSVCHMLMVLFLLQLHFTVAQQADIKLGKVLNASHARLDECP